jgi:hypothetical protein
MIKRALDWEPAIPFRAGLAKTYAWIQKQCGERAVQAFDCTVDH